MAFDTPGGSSGDGGAIELHVDTSQVAKYQQAEREIAQAMENVSREALKLELATDRAKKATSEHGIESNQAKRALIGLKDAEEAAARAADRQTRETNQLAQAQSRQRAGVGGLTRSVTGLVGAYVGAYGLVSGIRSALAAAREEELIQGQTRVTLERLGISYDEHESKLQRVIRATSQLGFDDEELLKSFQFLVVGTRDVDKALVNMALAADLSRRRYIDLESATNIVGKAQLGMSGALRRLQIDVDKGATATELLTFLTEKYGGAAEEVADTGQAALDRLNVEWENMKEIVGRGLLPTVTELADRLAAYFGDAENQAELQRRVNAAIEDGEAIVRGFAGAVRVTGNVLRPVVALLGGTEDAVRTLLIAMAVGKVLAFTGAIRGLGRAAVVTGGQLGAMGAMGAGGAIGGGLAPGGGGRGGPRGGLGALGIGGAILGGIVLGGLGTPPSLREQQRRVYDVSRADPGQALELAGAFHREFGTPLAALLDNNPFAKEYGGPSLATPGDIPFADREDRGAGAKSGARSGPKPATRDGGGGPRRPTLMELELGLSRAEARGEDTSGEIRAIRDHHAAEMRRLEAIKNLTKAQQERLRAAYQGVAAAQSRLDSLQEAEEAKIAEQRQAAAEKRERAREAHERKMERIREVAARQAERRGELLEGVAGRSDTRAGLRALSQRGVDATLKGLRDKQREQEGQLTREDVNRILNGFLDAFNDLQQNSASNFDRAVQMEIAHVNRQQLAEIRTIRGGTEAHEHFQATRLVGAGFDGF